MQSPMRFEGSILAIVPMRVDRRQAMWESGALPEARSKFASVFGARHTPHVTGLESPAGGRPTQRFVPDSLKLRTARFEHAHRRFAELSHIDHGIKLCPLFVDLGDRARSGDQKSSNSVCTDIQWESSSHQHLQIRQLSDEVAAKCS